MPVNSSAIRHFVKDVHDELVTAVDLDQRTRDLTCMDVSEKKTCSLLGGPLTVDDKHISLETVG